MKESIGGAYIFSICMTFIILFTAYLAISVNYAKAFRIKSYIVSMIEENEGLDGDLEQRISEYLVAEGYTAEGDCSPNISYDGDTFNGWGDLKEITLYSSRKPNVCIYKKEETGDNADDISDTNTYYKVVTFFRFDLPIVKTLFTFKVGGETKLIHQD